jgi:hypothetical protein
MFTESQTPYGTMKSVFNPKTKWHVCVSGVRPSRPQQRGMSELLETILWLKRSRWLRPRTGSLRGGLSQPATTGNFRFRFVVGDRRDACPTATRDKEYSISLPMSCCSAIGVPIPKKNQAGLEDRPDWFEMIFSMIMPSGSCAESAACSRQTAAAGAYSRLSSWVREQQTRQG